MKRIKVRTGKEYDVLIGSGKLADAGELIAEARPGRRAVIVTDSNVGGYVLVAVLAFAAAVIITVICMKRNKKE